MKIKIFITKEILKRSSICGVTTCYFTTNCAFALAFREIFPAAIVEYKYTAPFGDRNYKISNTAEMTEFIEHFDNNTPEQRIAMDERVFEFELPQWVIDRIGLSEVYKILSESKTLELVQI